MHMYVLHTSYDHFNAQYYAIHTYLLTSTEEALYMLCIQRTLFIEGIVRILRVLVWHLDFRSCESALFIQSILSGSIDIYI